MKPPVVGQSQIGRGELPLKRHNDSGREWLPLCLQTCRLAKNEKAGVVEHPEGLDHVGLLFNKPPSSAELLFT